MILSLNNQASLFLTTVLIGMFLGFLYDIIRTSRIIVRHSKWIVHIEDALYWIVIALIMFIIMLNENYGEIRFFSICGTFLGMLIYFLTISKLFMAVSTTLVNVIKKILLLIVKVILTPLRLVYLLFRKPVKKANNFVGTKSKKLLHYVKACVKIVMKRLMYQIKIILKYFT